MEERLLRGEIDLFIGVNTDPDPAFDIHTMADDEIMLIISSKLLHAHFDEEEINKMSAGVNLHHFRNIPFTLSFKTGKVNQVIMEYLNYHHLQLNVVYNVSDCETQIMLCASGICASLCPRMLLNTAYRHNLTSNEQNKLYMLPINKLDRPLHIDMVSHKDVIQPAFIRRFIALTQEEVQQISHQ
ncbi:LysR substrate binding domain protein [anaerobic digester metagenome]